MVDRRTSSFFPSILQYTLDLPDGLLTAAVGEVQRSTKLGGRIGREWHPTKNVKMRKDDDAWIDRQAFKPLDDVCTKFCTNMFFPDATARMNMVGNVIRLYDRLAKLHGFKYKIIFKGGVMLRLVLLHFFRRFPDTTSHMAIQYLRDEKAIGLGDFDFEIVPDDEYPSQETLYRYLYVNTFVLMLLQKSLVSEIRAGKSGLLTTGWDVAAAETDLKGRLQKEVAGLPSEHPLHGATVERVVVGSRVRDPPRGFETRNGRTSPEQRASIFIFRCGTGGGSDGGGDGETCVCDVSTVAQEMGMSERTMRAMGISGGGNDFLYTTCNTHINEIPPPRTRRQELNPHFHLSRIKHTFTMYYTTADGRRRCDRLAGEMVDLSMGDPSDEIRNWKHEVIPGDDYRDYPIVGVEEVVFRSYSPANFLKDHEQMIHLRETPPWLVPKYEKRVVRYSAFLVLYVMSEVRTGSRERLQALRQLIRYLGSDLDEPMDRTGVEVVDHFAHTEFEAMREGAAPAEKRKYLDTVVRHLSTIVSIVRVGLRELTGGDSPFEAMDITHLDYMERHRISQK